MSKGVVVLITVSHSLSLYVFPFTYLVKDIWPYYADDSSDGTSMNPLECVDVADTEYTATFLLPS